MRLLLLALLFGWPVSPPSVVRRFDPPPLPWLAGHRGVDLAAPPAAPVRAAGPGTVVFAGRVAGRGVISVAHPGGLRTTYEPVTATVAAGVTVAAGAPLGTLEAGHPGCPSATCLHWGLRRGDRYLDPLALLGLGRVRLLPLAQSSLGPAAAGRVLPPPADGCGIIDAGRHAAGGLLVPWTAAGLSARGGAGPVGCPPSGPPWRCHHRAARGRSGGVRRLVPRGRVARSTGQRW